VEIHGDDHVDGFAVRTAERVRRLDVGGVFVEVGLFPNSDFILDLVDTNPRGEIKVDARGRTGVQGIFAAGDVTDTPDKQIVIAAGTGTGARAALGAFHYLVQQA
jgi:alkyl hydroperoxide reductase subunit F